MKPIKLTGIRADGKEAYVHACGTCGIVARSEQDAERCCAPCACGEAMRPYSDVCDACRNRDWREKEQTREAERRAKAKRVKWADYGGDCIVHGNRFYNDCEEMFDHYWPEPPPREAWGTTMQKLSITARHVLENALEEHHEDAAEGISDAQVAELQTFLEAWCERTGVVTYYEDSSVLVDLSDEADRWLAEGESLDGGEASHG